MVSLYSGVVRNFLVQKFYGDMKMRPTHSAPTLAPTVAAVGRSSQSSIPWLALGSVLLASLLGAKAVESTKAVIGATAVIQETSSGISFPARVDTGAKTCSLHVEQWKIENEAKKMRANKGKPIRFQVANNDGELVWLESTVAGYAIYKTSEKQERRYKVRLKLKWKDLEKSVLVNLNDRSHLEFPLLLGRNFLRGDFLVDVDIDNNE